MRIANADILPFDFRSLQKTVNGFAGEVMSLLEQTREATSTENQLIKEGRFVQAADPTETYIPPVAKDEVPFIDFSPLQNAISKMEKSSQQLYDISGRATIATDRWFASSWLVSSQHLCTGFLYWLWR